MSDSRFETIIPLLRLFRRHFELLFWIGTLIFLGITASPASHFSFCLIKLSGIPWCPGCGIGHAIGYLLQGHLRLSWEAHVLGIPALLVILNRIYNLLPLRNIAKTRRRGGSQRSILINSSYFRENYNHTSKY